MAIYWIHRSIHTNIFTEGYIGVSSNPKRRFSDHKRRTDNSHLVNAFKKYKDIILSIIFNGSEKVCYEIEQHLRSTENIGWNINIGGTKPPVSKKGQKHPKIGPLSKEHREKIRQAALNRSIEVNKRYGERLAKDWIVVNPLGESFEIHNLKQFCEENNLHQGHMNAVASGKLNHYKHWNCKEKLE